MPYCKNGQKSKVVNKSLYNRLKAVVKRRAKVWPSAYASGQLVRMYKSKGGKYTCNRNRFGSLGRWFKEKWVNVCKPLGNGKYQTCGRKKSSWKNYPYCRPLHRINKNTPVTVREMSKTKIKKMCSRKRKNPRKKVFQRNKNNFGNYEMNRQEQQTCGFGRRSRFGNNLGPTNSNLDTFYKNGTANSLMPRTNCLSGYYGKPVSRFGKKRVNFIQRANAASKRKGTVGSFNRWCRRHGYPKVTTACINKAKKNKSLKIRRKGIFAQNIRSSKRSYSFGSKIDTYRSLSLRDLQDELEVAEEEYQRKLAMRGRDQTTLDLLAREYKENTLDLLLQAIKEKTIPRLANRERGLNTTSISERARIRQREKDLEREQVYRRESQQLAKMRECKANCNVMFGKRKKVKGNVTSRLTSDIKYLRSLR
jgi:hypothetical protein